MISGEEETLLDELNDYNSSFYSYLYKMIYDPFKYEKKLAGKAVDDFFEEGAYKVTLHQVRENRFILVGEALSH